MTQKADRELLKEGIKMIKAKKKCENCIFYEKDEDEKGQGHCYDIFDEENQGEIVEGSYYVCGSFVDINDVERRSKIQRIDILKEIEKVKKQFEVK